ncbi:MAG: hypothetical protein U1E76_13440 [Planctomycetota bacterium]
MSLAESFERDIFRDRVRAGIIQARKEGRPHGRPRTAAKLFDQMRVLAEETDEHTKNRQASEDKQHFGDPTSAAPGTDRKGT